MALYPAGDQLGGIGNNPHNRDYAEALRDWARLAPGRVAVWNWSGNSGNAVVEWPNILSVCDGIRFFHELGVSAVMLGMPAGDLNWGWLRKWVWMKPVTCGSGVATGTAPTTTRAVRSRTRPGLLWAA